MTIQMLRYLVLAAETGTLRAAAEASGVTQPTLSSQLAKLESELDQTLLERDRQGVRPTPVGRRVIEHARAVLRETEALRSACRPRVHPLAGPLRLGVIPTVGTYVLPRLLPVLNHAYPETDLHLHEGVTASLVRMIKAGELDAALMSLPIEEPTLTHGKVLDEPFYAIVPSDHALAAHEKLDRKVLLESDLLLLAEGHCLREQTASFCQLPAQRRVIQATSVESLRLMVAGGLGCSILPRMAVTGKYARQAGVAVRPFAPPVPTRAVVLAWRKSHHEFGALRKLARRFGEAMRDMD